MSRKSRDDEIIRDMLVRVGEAEHINQRTQSKELGIALGMTNAYLKRCVRKGLIKISEIPPNRYAYYLTPQGFTEKTRLTAEFLSDSLIYFRRARSQYLEIYGQCLNLGWNKLVLAGASELSEIAILAAREHNVDIQGVIVKNEENSSCYGLPDLKGITASNKPDAVIKTELSKPQEEYDNLIKLVSAKRVFAPPILNIDRWSQNPK